MQSDSGASGLLAFIHNSPTAFHATQNARARLLAAGFSELHEADKWSLTRGGKYFVTRNGSAFLALQIGTADLACTGLRMVAAHTDSPGFLIKPRAEMRVDGYCKLNTAVYGGPILNTWFDRPLGIAGRVLARGGSAFAPEIIYINMNKPLLVIPSLAIHFNAEANTGYAFNAQKDTLPLAGFVDAALEKDDYLLNLLAAETGRAKDDILDFDLFLYEYEKGCVMGAQNEFISAPRLDDLWMVYAGLVAICAAAPAAHTTVLYCADNEEVGNRTLSGAESAFAREVLERIVTALGGTAEDYARIAAQSIAASADMAHAVHPNYGEKHDPVVRPVLGGGIVVKHSPNRRYATDGQGAAIFTEICRRANVRCQAYVNRSDIAGGSTIGNALATGLSIRVVDVGVPILAMHSIRELGACADVENAIEAFKAFYTLI